MIENAETRLKEQLFAQNAARFDEACIHEGDEHNFALGALLGLLDFLQIESVLDVGAGTGRTLVYLKEKRPRLKVWGIEPVPAQRQQGYNKGIAEQELLAGNATALQFGDGEFDLVCEFGVLHHIRDHRRAVAEMLRVAKKAVFLSDSNNFGQGKLLARTVKQAARGLGLWGLVNWLKTRGKGYAITPDDGLFYSYSVFDDYPLLRKECRRIHFLNTQDSGPNLYRSGGHVAMLGIK
jgi:ubiquinone/menaquinone biosynthesis C-methylase UbiE